MCTCVVYVGHWADGLNPGRNVGLPSSVMGLRIDGLNLGQDYWSLFAFVVGQRTDGLNPGSTVGLCLQV